ncbi:hypothetical protein EXIGUO8H_370002 [Exiguobacterium sp. 8H]|uniref:hypothetical protein n=1 Tax=unclassified Exiguobacterium TaxID=2644629 RepID=UPI0012F31F32|nr:MULTISPECIES: hypothetical protein [unclassified Exiguobacterium]VXB83494.1 hypothetical protein EXIGUO8H_370002 [Exiguobacterium sp. 8H]VXB93091.1 hypothetical protein EXIGUO8A_260016 [Exiguobacterium sp. 8A]
MDEEYVRSRKLYQELEAKPGTVATIMVVVPGSDPVEFRYSVGPRGLCCEVSASKMPIHVPVNIWTMKFIELCDQIDADLWDEAR